ncbi:MAG TPA: triose-phosphate isomerase [Saccharofermentans sp.]|jgi:triosephosphate isomerase (TIM)|nr:triose-phosphate isomerase [Clostridia bacterium]NLX68191.1 triose-phosphate isomerase [Clostridiaceae bacterium]HPE27786.1 triose-phosphate isomerase [Saccharofermentans sp.]HPG63735.1 triose-phosphate isomerase [Saccharofermentans sp.]HPJ81033.1 triose-phosphate isomerase [Saccharofermentans sp.]
MAMVQKKNVEDLNVAGKKVIVRVDFNVPLDKTTNEITDDKRIKGALPTIKYLVENNAKVILVSHLGRPKNGPEAKFSMKPAADRLAELIGKPVVLASDVIGEDAKSKAAALKEGEILMLENVRFHKEETKNDPKFAAELASMADLYVNDAFGTAHRAHASTAGLANFLPSASGYLIQKELDFIGGALANPKRPFVAILGGSKVSDKIGVISNLIDKADTIIIGGGMAYTFAAAKGASIGTSLCEPDKFDLANELVAKAEAKGVKLLLPVDTVCADAFAEDANSQVVESGKIPDGWMGLDIGPKSIELFSAEIANAKTIIWNGPAGVFEFDKFATGTRALAKAIADSDAISIIGGGDSAAAIEKLGFAEKVSHISTGGGASLEFIEGKVLPGIDCLQDKEIGRTFAAGNWKMNCGCPDDAAKLINELKPLVKDATSTIALGVPFLAIPAALEAAAYSNIKIAAQNCHFEEKGAFTGEISPLWLAKMGVTYVIIGHSERREYFAETDETVNKKAKAALSYGLKPIICCGESLAQREANETFDWIKGQIIGAFKDIPAEKLCQITIAYEPIWAIGTGKTASDEQAQEVCAFIRGVIAELYCDKCAAAMTIQYGGSVNAKTAAGLFSQKDINGGLVGGASLKAEDFSIIALA